VFDEVSRQVSMDGPRFVIAHIWAPHNPFVYGKNGEATNHKPWGIGDPEVDVAGYADQVNYLNKILRGLISDILDKSSSPPIIILQGDHGLRLTWYANMNEGVDDPLEKACLREVFSNLNALYLPGNKSQEFFYDSISPVNTFRLIFDTYFGTQLGMLEDRSFFAIENDEDLTMDITEVTDLRETCSPAWEQQFRDLP
jgi:hypothetical protein